MIKKLENVALNLNDVILVANNSCRMSTVNACGSVVVLSRPGVPNDVIVLEVSPDVASEIIEAINQTPSSIPVESSTKI